MKRPPMASLRPILRSIALAGFLAIGAASLYAQTVVTAGAITFSGATGLAGAYKIGDTVIAQWDDTVATGDGAANGGGSVLSISFDFSQFGGGAAVAGSLASGSDGDGIYQATFALAGGGIDYSTLRTVSVTASVAAMGGSSTTASSMTATVDNMAPSLPTVTIAQAGSGRGGVFATQNSAVTLTISSSESLSSLTATIEGGAAAPAGGPVAWTASRTLPVAALASGSSIAFSIDATDQAGNVTSGVSAITSGSNLTAYNTLASVLDGDPAAPATWDLGVAPAANDVLSSANILTQTGNFTAWSLANTGTWDTNGSNLTLTSTFSNPGMIRHSGAGTMALVFDSSQGTAELYGGTGFPFGYTYRHLSITGGTHTLASNLSVLGNLSVASANLALGGNTLAVTGTATIDTGAAAISLPGANTFGSTVYLTTTSSATIAATGTITLGTTSVGSTLTATSTAGSLGQVNPIAAASLVANAATGITLGSANSVSAFSATNTGSGNISLVNTLALSLGTVTGVVGSTVTVSNGDSIVLAGTVSAAGGTVSLDTKSASGITYSSGGLVGTTLNLQTNALSTGAVAVSGTPLLTSGAGATLNLGNSPIAGAFVAHTGALSLATPVLALNAPLRVSSSGALTLPAAAIDTGSGDLYLASGTGLSTAGNLSSSASLTLIAGGGNIGLGHNLTGGNLVLQASALVNQTAGILSGASLTVSGAGGIDLGQANTLAAFNASNTGGGNLNLLNTANPLTVSLATNVGGGNVTIQNTGDVTTSGAVSTTGAGTISITGTAGLVTIGAAVTTGTGTLGITGVGLTNNSTITGGGNITLDAGTGTLTNAGGRTITNGGGTAQITLQGDRIALSGTVTGGSGAVRVRPSTVALGMDLGSGTDLAGYPEVSNAELLTITTTGVLTLGRATETGAISVTAALAPSNATGGLVITNQQGGIALGANVTSASTLTVTANGGGAVAGAISWTAGSLVSNGAVALSAATGIGAPALNPVTIGATGGGNVTATNTTSGDVYLSSTSGVVTIGTNYLFPAGVIANLRVDGSGNVVVAAAPVATPTASLTLNATGTITRTGGTLAAPTVRLGTSGTTTSVGTLALPILTAATSYLGAASSAGAVYVTNTGNLADANIAATGGLVNLQDTGSVSLATGSITSSTAVTVNATGLVTVGAGRAVTAGAGAAVSLTGLGITNSGTVTGPGGITLNAGTGTLTNGGGLVSTNTAIGLTANDMALGGGTIGSGSGDVTLAPSTAATPITLGGGLANLGLSNAELGTITTSGILLVGGAGITGAITVDGAVALSLATGAVTLRNTTGGIAVNSGLSVPGALTLQSGAAVSGAGAISSTVSQSLTVSAVGGINLTGASTVQAVGLTNITSGAIAYTGSSVGAGNALTVSGSNGAGGTLGITVTETTGGLTVGAAGLVANTAGTSVSLSAAQAVVVNGVVTTSGAGTLGITGVGLTNNSTITGGGTITLDAGTGTLTNAGGRTITNGGGAAQITLQGDRMVLSGTITGGSGSVTLRPKTLALALGLGPATDAAGYPELSDAELKTITTTGLLTLGDPLETGTIAVTAAVAPTNATGGISIQNRTNDISLGGSVTSAAGLTIKADNLAGVGKITWTAGSLTTAGAGTLTLNAATGIGALGASPVTISGLGTGGVTVNNTTSGDVYLSSSAGTITIGTNYFINGNMGTLRLDSSTSIVIAASPAAAISTAIALNANGAGTITRTGGTLTAPTVELGVSGTTTAVGTNLARIFTAATTLLDARATNGVGVFVTNTGNLNFRGSAGTGAVSLVNTGTTSLAAGGAVAGATVNISSSGDLTVGNNVTGSTGVTLTVTGGGSLSHTAGTISTTASPITLQADVISLAGALISSGAANTYILPMTGGTSSSLGGAAGFDLTDTELNTITAGTIFVGEDSAAARTSATLTVGASSALNLGARNITLSGSNIQGGANTLTTGALGLKAANGIGSATTLATASSSIAIANTAAGIVSIQDSRAGGTSVSGSNAAAGASLILVETGAAGITVGAPLSTSNGVITLRGDTMAVTSTISSGTANTYLLPNTTPTAVSIGGASAFDLSAAELVNITAGTIVVGEDSGAAVTAGALTIGDSGAVNIGNRALTLSGRVLSDINQNRLTTGSGILTLKASTTGGIGTIPLPIRTASATIVFSSAGTAGDVAISDITAAGTSYQGINGFNGGAVWLRQGTAGQAITLSGPVSSNNGPITLLADNMTLGSGITAGSGNVVLTSFSAGRIIDIGTNSGGNLGLVQAELNQVTTTGSLTIGDAAHTGVIQITAAITMDVARASSFSILSTGIGGTISQGAGFNLIGTGLPLSLTANGAISLSGTIQTNGFPINLTAASVALGGAVTIDSTAASTVPVGAAIAISAPITGAQALTIHSGQTSQSLGSQIGTNVLNLTSLTVRSDNIVLTADTYATATNFYMETPGTTMGLGGAAGAWQLDDAEIARLKSFTTLTLGQAGVQSGLVTIDTMLSPVAAGAIVVNSDAGAGGILLADSGIADALASTSGNLTLNAGSSGIKASNATSGAFSELKTTGNIALNVNAGANGIGSAGNRIDLNSTGLLQAVNSGGANGAFYLNGVIAPVRLGTGTSASNGGAIDITGGANLAFAGTVLNSAGGNIDLYGTVVLGQNSTINLGAGAAYLEFHGAVNAAVDGTQSLTIANGGTGQTRFDGIVGAGGTLRPSSLTVSGGPTLVSTSAIATSTTQSYAGNLTLGVTSNFTGTTITYSGNVDGGSHDLTVTGAAVIGTAAGNSLTNTGVLRITGTTALHSGTVTTTDNQTYDANLTMFSNAILTSAAGKLVWFKGTVGGLGTAYTLGIAGANAQFDLAVGGVANLLDSLSVAGTTLIKAPTVTTVNNQAYTGKLTLGASTNLTANLVTLSDDVDGSASNYNLTIACPAVVGTAAGNQVINVGVLNITGTTALHSATVTTTGNQTYGSAATLYANTTFTSALGNLVRFDGTLDGNGAVRDLIIATANARFSSTVGMVANLIGSITVGGTTAVYGTIRSATTQTYTGALGINASAALYSSGGGLVTFSSTTTIGDGFTLTLGNGGATGIFDTQGILGTPAGLASNLTVNTTGTVLVRGVVGTDLATVLVTDSGGLTFQGTVSAATVTLNATTGIIRFDSALTATTLNTAVAGYSLSILGGCDITAAATLSNTGTIVLGDNAADVLLFRGGLAATSAGTRQAAGILRTIGQTIGLGASTLTADTVLDSTNNGGSAAGATITVAGLTAPGFTVVVNAGTGGGFTQSAGSITASSLRLIANGSIGTAMGTPVYTAVSFLEALSYSGTVFISNTTSFTVGFAGGAFAALGALNTSGLATAGANAAGLAATSAGADITFVEAATAGATGSFTATAHSLDIGAAITGNGGIALYPNADSLGIALSDGPGAFSLTLAELNLLVSTGTLTIGLTAGVGSSNAIAIGTVIAADLSSRAYNLTLQSANLGLTFAVVLTLGNDKTMIVNLGTGAITGSGGLDIYLPKTVGSGILQLTAGNIGNSLGPVPLKTQVDILRVLSSGYVRISEVDALQLGDAILGVSSSGGLIDVVAVGAVTQGITGITTNTGSIGIESTGSSLTVTSSISTTGVGGGSISMIAGTNIALSAAVGAANNSQISLTATAGSITHSGASAVGAAASTSTLELSAGTFIGVDGGADNAPDATWLLTDVGVVRGTALGGGIFISEASGLQLGDATAGLTVPAGKLDVVLGAGGAMTTGTVNTVSASTTFLLTAPAGITISGDLTGGSGLGTFTNSVAHTSGTITSGTGGLLYSSNYFASGTANLVGTSGVDIQFVGNVALLGFVHGDNRLVFAGTALQTFDSNLQVLNNVRINNASGVRLVTSSARQIAPSPYLDIVSGFLDLDTNNQGWLMDSALGGPPGDAFTGNVGTLNMVASTGLLCGGFTTSPGFVVTNTVAGISTLTVSGNALIQEDFVNPTRFLLVMTGTATLDSPGPIQLGSLTIQGAISLNSPVYLAGDLVINAGHSLDVVAPANIIDLYGNWTNNAGNAGFVAAGGRVNILKPSGSVSIVGTTTWRDFVCEVPGLTILFDNNPAVHTFQGVFRIFSPGADIILSRLNGAAGIPGSPYVFPADATKFWDIDIQGSATLELQNVSIYYSNAYLNPRIASETAHVGAGAPYYDYKWRSGLTLVYSYTEDSDGNGKIDRIRVQASGTLNSDFSGFKASVTGYTIKGYSDPGNTNTFYIELEEKPYNDTGATPPWTILSNTTLVDSTLPWALAATFTNPLPMIPTDTAFPRIAYTLALPGIDQVFVHASEPLDDNPVVVGFSLTGGYAVDTINQVTGSALAGYSEYMVNLATNLALADLLSGGVTLTVSGAFDLGVAPIDASIAENSLPVPTFPIDSSYSGYSPIGLVPPYAPTAAGATHRISDLLISAPYMAIPPGGYPDYFVWPIWAKDQVKLSLTDAAIEAMSPAATAAMGPGLIRAFDGTQWLRDQDIKIQSRINLLSGQPTLIYDTSPAARFVNSVSGLWLPTFAETAFSGLAGYPDDPAHSGSTALGLTSLTQPSPDLYNITVDSTNPKVVSGKSFEFFYRLAGAPADLYAARLDMAPGAALPANWYRLVRPFSFELHDLKLQAGSVTILNNVIDPTKGETVRLAYKLASAGQTTITVFTLDGDVVTRLFMGQRTAGEYSISWDGKNNGGRAVARGVYFIRVVAPGVDEIRKVMVVRK